MFRLVVIACLAAVAVAKSKYDECGELQRLKVKDQWRLAYGDGEQRETFDLDLWRRIIDKKPDVVEKFFDRVHGYNIYSPEFKAHAARVMGGFDMSITMINLEDEFNAQLAHLHAQHKELDVDAEYFDVFLDALLYAVQKRVPCFDQDAWKVCGRLIENGIKH